MTGSRKCKMAVAEPEVHVTLLIDYTAVHSIFDRLKKPPRKIRWECVRALRTFTSQFVFSGCVWLKQAGYGNIMSIIDMLHAASKTPIVNRVIFRSILVHQVFGVPFELVA